MRVIKFLIGEVYFTKKRGKGEEKMDSISAFFQSIGDWFNSITLAGIIEGIQNFLDNFGEIAQAFFDALP